MGDSFSVAVFGVVNTNRGNSTVQVRGTSTIQVAVSVVPIGTRAISSCRSLRRVRDGTSALITPMTADTTPPSVSFAAPSDGATVSGSLVTLMATTSDDVAVASVQFIVGGKNIGSVVTSPPYAIVSDSTELRTVRTRSMRLHRIPPATTRPPRSASP